MLHKEIISCFTQVLEEYPQKSGEQLQAYKDYECTVECTNSPKISVKDYFHQSFDRFKPSIIENLICSWLWQEILRGNLSYRIQETPQCFPDKEIENNKDLVKSYIDCVTDKNIIDADFWGGTQGEDGFIKFAKPIGEKHRRLYFPLEVGYCKSTQFYYHIKISNCIARLPYGKDYIIYFEYLKPERFYLF